VRRLNARALWERLLSHPHRANRVTGRTGRTVIFHVCANLTALGAFAFLSIGALTEHLINLTDQEIEKYSDMPLPAEGRTPALDRESLVLVLNRKGRVTKRFAGDPSLPGFPALSVDRLQSYADHGRPVTVEATTSATGAYRALVVPEARNGGYRITAWSLESTRRAATRLLPIEGIVALLVLAAVAIGSLRMCLRENRERQAFERRLREFLAAAGHELRNPLTAISGYAELARMGSSSPYDGTGALVRDRVHDEALSRVANEIDRMSSLIDELVLLSRLDLGQPLQIRCVDLGRLCRDTCAAERGRHSEHPLRLLVAPGEHTVAGDPQRLHQVVTNLLANARLHTPDGTPVTLGVGTEDGYRIIEVMDEGPGVPPELRTRIFERFVRGEETTAPGSGLGLSIVAAIVAAHGGTVTLEPSGHGAWFRVRLPAAP
jgi:signal transduction histidine kinase